MAGYKEVPRQKMIAMLYLILTAMLALNVSVEILNAFTLVNESILTTNENFSSKIDNNYSRFLALYNNSPEKVAPVWEKAQKVKKSAQEMKQYIETIKNEVVAKTENISLDQAKNTPLREIKNKDNYDTPTRYFIGESNDGSKGKAGELRNRIDKFRQELLSYLTPEQQKTVNIGLKTEGTFKDASGSKLNWEMFNFYHTILAADVTILNKLYNEVQNAEFDITSKLMSSISENSFNIDQVGATIVPKSQYVFLGEAFEAEVYVTAMDTKQSFSANIGGSTYNSSNGSVKITAPAGSIGAKTINGVVNMKDPTGQMKAYPFSYEYIVTPPALAVSATKMNVFYIGVDNPVAISAGVPPSQISASMTNGSINRSGAGWVVRPSSPGKAMVTVNANLNGKVKRMGAVEYRVKYLPSPTAYIANTDGGLVSKSLLAASSAIIPRMPQDFEFDVNYIVTSFKMSANRKGDFVEVRADGNRLTQQMRDLIQSSRSRDKVNFEDIMAKGPDGKVRKLNSIVITIQ